MRTKLEPKNKSNLDLMTKREIEEYRYNFLSQYPSQQVAARYGKELDLYLKTRFPEDEFNRYERWLEQSKNPTPDEGVELIARIINEMGVIKFYEESIRTEREELGRMVYIDV